MTGIKCRISFNSSSPLGLFFLGDIMDLVKVQKRFFDKCKEAGVDPNNQLLHNEAGRPCVLIVKLKYKGKKRNFVVPMKSTITPETDKNTYFALPPNNRTRAGNFHGVFYIKLFPINKQYIHPYLINKNEYLVKIKGMIDDSTKEIIAACQNYLDEYEKRSRNYYTPDIDAILNILDA